MTERDETFLREVIAGLSKSPKSLSPKWLYDQRGSEIFEEITNAPEYYPTRTEAIIFETALPELGRMLQNVDTVVEYGSGSSKKTVALIEHLSPTTYIPIDISEAFLLEAAEELRGEVDDEVSVRPLAADFNEDVQLPQGIASPSGRLGFFPGSTLGNLEPDEAVSFLKRAKRALGSSAHFLLGIDLVKPRDILVAAYDDAGGVTAAFNLNLLTRINRELGGDFDVDAFSHRAIYDDERSRIEMHLVASGPQTVHIGDRTFEFAEGETLHTENSHKFTVDSVEALAREAGWSLVHVWTDPKDWFAVVLLKAD